VGASHRLGGVDGFGRKKIRCGFESLGGKVLAETSTVSLRRSESFEKNIQVLQMQFPEVPHGVVVSMLESSNNDGHEAQSLIRHVCEAADASSNCSRKRRMPDDWKSACFREQDCVSDDRSDWGVGHDEASDNGRKFRRCDERENVMSEGPEASSPSLLVGGNKSVVGKDVEILRGKLEQYKQNQLVFAKAVRLQFRTIQELRGSIQEKDAERESLGCELRQVKDQLKKQQDAFQALQSYIVDAVRNGGGQPPGAGGCHGGFSDFFGGSLPDVF